MQLEKLWGWWSHRQGLDGSLSDASSREILQRVGWQRSVGGANPYLALWARNGASRESVDADNAALELFELPSARGCTYVLPAEHFALGLKAGESFADAAVAPARRHLGVTDAEVDGLGEKVLRALESGPADPRQLKEVLGDAVRSFGEEGKKRGVTTDLPLALGRLQSQGRIRRIPANGRLDQQRFSYELWSPSPFAGCGLSLDQAYVELARLFFGWIGPATVGEFRWFSGLGAGAAKKAVAELDLVAMEGGSDRMLLASDKAAFDAFEPSESEDVRLVGSLDSHFLLRRDAAGLIHPDQQGLEVLAEKKVSNVGNLVDLPFNAIVDRGPAGRLLGLRCGCGRGGLVGSGQTESGDARGGRADAILHPSRPGGCSDFQFGQPKGAGTAVGGFEKVEGLALPRTVTSTLRLRCPH